MEVRPYISNSYFCKAKQFDLDSLSNHLQSTIGQQKANTGSKIPSQSFLSNIQDIFQSQMANSKSKQATILSNRDFHWFRQHIQRRIAGIR